MDSPIPPAHASPDDPRTLALAALRAWRREKADAMRVPPYFVFPNRTLDAIVDAWPRDHAALARVRGVGPSRLAHHGAAILDVLARFPPQAPRAPPLPEAPTSIELDGGLRDIVDALSREEGRTPREVVASALRLYAAAREHVGAQNHP